MPATTPTPWPAGAGHGRPAVWSAMTAAAEAALTAGGYKEAAK